MSGTMIALLVALATAAAAPVKNTDPATLFPDLAHVELKPERVRVFYPAAAAQPVAARAQYLKSYDEAGVFASQPIALRLGHGVPPATVTCDSGPSADPSCRLLTSANDPGSTIFESSGVAFAFLQNADIYVFGQSDSLYDHRRLFRWDGARYAEVAQPFRYVGIEGRTTSLLALTSERGGDTTHPLASLVAGTPLTILLNAATGDDEDGGNADYLVKTREGLIGWARIPTQPDGKTLVSGLFFAGD